MWSIDKKDDVFNGNNNNDDDHRACGCNTMELDSNRSSELIITSEYDVIYSVMMRVKNIVYFDSCEL